MDMLLRKHGIKPSKFDQRELQTIVRQIFKLSTSEVTLEEVKSLFRHLDIAVNNYISLDNFEAFVVNGQPLEEAFCLPAPPSNKALLEEASRNLAEKKRLQAEKAEEEKRQAEEKKARLEAAQVKQRCASMAAAEKHAPYPCSNIQVRFGAKIQRSPSDLPLDS